MRLSRRPATVAASTGRLPDQSSVLLGLNSLDLLLLQDGCEQALQDAASVLELFVATGGVVGKGAEARTRFGLLAAAVRRAMTDG